MIKEEGVCVCVHYQRREMNRMEKQCNESLTGSNVWLLAVCGYYGKDVNAFHRTLILHNDGPKLQVLLGPVSRPIV